MGLLSGLSGLGRKVDAMRLAPADKGLLINAYSDPEPFFRRQVTVFREFLVRSKLFKP